MVRRLAPLGEEVSPEGTRRRIRFVRVGRYVRIPETALREFIAAGVVEPMTVSDVWPTRPKVA
jgi:hypothetical protein